MSRAIRTARVSLFALAVATVLGFGASTALAGPPICPRTAVGKCTSLAQCQSTCAAIGADPAGARCDATQGVGCCFCPFVL